MRTIRTKTVTFDGVPFRIGSLTMWQVSDAIVAKSGDSETAKAAQSFKLVMHGLNNGRRWWQLVRWTPKRVAKSIGVPLFKFLQDEIVTLSDIRIEKTSAGETQPERTVQLPSPKPDSGSLPSSAGPLSTSTA